MAAFTSTQIKRLTAVHGWSGVLLGLLLYAVVVTGTAVVFAPEVALWSVGGQRVEEPLSNPIDGTVRSALDKVTGGYLGEIYIYGNERGDLLVFPHAHVTHPETGELSDYGPLFRIDPESGEVLSRRLGFVYDHPHWYDASALRHFLVELHVQLSVPEPWGLLLTGILGLLAMVAAVTGIVMHRHMIRDLFLPERPGKRLVSFRDRHVLAGSWSLPFAFLLGFTGAYFSFASTVLFPVLADVAFAGDEQAMNETLYEAPVPPDPTPVPMANLDAIVADAEARYDSATTFVAIERYGQADSRIWVYQPPVQGALQYRDSVYDGASGAYIGVWPSIGAAPSTGSFLYGLMYPLHFGDFAGILSKAVWVGLGSAMAFVVVSGLRLWVRRREEERLWRRFGRALTAVAWGLPLAMAGSAWACFLSMGSADPFWWTPAGFVIVALASIALGAVVPDERLLARLFRVATAAALMGLPVVRMAAGGTDWIAALAQGQGTVLSIDLLLLAGGGALMFWKSDARNAAAVRPVAEPAE